ncbi:ornithine decarboxylase antizyme with +1 programmed ribosomal shift Spa1 [Stylosanthes scabra]|uniref:Ornithine decarboxylase antizyme with +1 programmed ribosomal shift Spa1 n=1 Tax=Stylosanthes scabra TaxID=79078 RepID=A0ABU6Z556_9FABA|nr:ornithine decarboxylase antizyme with +1 programmed ribosomal shift Spa1 [Stylosanthes scabra]
MTPNGGTGTEEQQQQQQQQQHKRKVFDSLLKSSVQKSPRLCTTIREGWPEILENEDNNLSRCVGSLAGSGPPSTSYCSMTDSAHIIEDLTVTTQNKNLNFYPQRNQLAIESRYSSLTREILPQDEEQIPLRLSKGVNGIDSEFRGLKSSLRVSSNRSNVDKIFTSSNGIVINGATQNTSSAYSVSHLILKQTVKGKGVICKDFDGRIGPAGAVLMRQEEDESQSDMPRPDATDKMPSLQVTVKSGTGSSNDGMNLREWLRPQDHKIDKSGRLQIFKQILELVDFAHSQGVVMLNLRPSCFTLSPSSSKIKYIGSSGRQELHKFLTCNVNKRMSLEQDAGANQILRMKQQNPYQETRSLRQHRHFTSIHGCRTTTANQTGSSVNESTELEEKKCMSLVQLEEKWYSSPEELDGGVCTFSSNIYSLGVLLFELLCNIESWELHSSVMSDLCHRILPPRFLSENPKEAGFCLWLLHPDPSSRPNTRMILESQFIVESEKSNSSDDVPPVGVSDDDEAETQQLLHFLVTLKDEKKKQESKLVEELSWLDEDIKLVERSNSLETDSLFPSKQVNYPELTGSSYHFPEHAISSANEARFLSNINQLESSYFSMRCQMLLKDTSAAANYDKDVIESRYRLPHAENVIKEPSRIQSSAGSLGTFFEGLCKFARYSKFEERGTLRNRDLLSSANVICALSFDRDEDYIYPVVEMSNKSKLSCVCWNSYIKNHLASTDYDGVVQMWDAGTGQPLSQYMEHQKRAWSVHFSLSDPKMFASGSDDCSVKLWNIGERNSVGTIWNPANVCCVQFSSFSTHLLFFGSADYKVYGYDLRHTRVPWCTLGGHGKAVSYVKSVDAETVVSASTDNSLKLWDLKKASSSGLSSDACALTFKGHSNEKNFVGLSVTDGYIACGSETNEVYCYHKSLPLPITSHKFESIDPVSGHSTSDDNNGQFVSSVCWRKKSNMLVAANSIGIVKLLQMV